MFDNGEDEDVNLQFCQFNTLDQALVNYLKLSIFRETSHLCQQNIKKQNGVLSYYFLIKHILT